jgi:hypothetical protein
MKRIRALAKVCRSRGRRRSRDESERSSAATAAIPTGGYNVGLDQLDGGTQKCCAADEMLLRLSDCVRVFIHINSGA